MADTEYADTEYGAVATTNIVQPGDSILLARGGVPYRFTGPLPAIDPAGNFLIGTASAAYGAAHTIDKAAAESFGIAVVQSSSTGAKSAVFLAVPFEGWNTAGAALWLGRNGNGRSLNAAGTVNAAGADYAEYMAKAPGCGDIAKGDVCGVDAHGQLTRKWADAISFVVKSLEPGFVGGDTWGIDREGDELEAARLGVDRIAFCGQVPVNVTGDAAVGDYIIAAPNGSGIKAVAVAEAEIAFEQYRRRLGKVWTIREGRPIIDVQHG